MPKRAIDPDDNLPSACLVEVAWEVCNQIGGIYTVIRSKAPAMKDRWGDDYCMVGPYLHKNILAELEPIDTAEDLFGQAARNMKKKGHEVIYAEWLITGKPRVLLVNPNSVTEKTRNVIKYLLWKNHGIGTPENPLVEVDSDVFHTGAECHVRTAYAVQASSLIRGR